MLNSAIHGESGYERVANDAYYTPAWCTEALLRHVKFDEDVWEPAAGNGQIRDVLQESGYAVWATDLYYYSDLEMIYRHDFFNTDADRAAIITNPPYDQARQFIERSIELTKPHRGKVAMLLRNEYDSAATRQHLFSESPCFAMKLVLTKRPKWVASDKASPRHNFAWFVWDWQHEGPSQIIWDQ